MPIVPDSKDWTWVLEHVCEECGFEAAAVDPGTLAQAIHDNTKAWYDVLDRPDVRIRRQPDRWSDLEYACHVRDVHLLFGERVGLMLAEDDPAFAYWNQDDTADAGRYAEQDPQQVVVELVEAAADAAAHYFSVTDWSRTGRRSDGLEFTVASLGRYHLHDVVHHVHDVGA